MVYYSVTYQIYKYTSHEINNIEYQTSYQSNARTTYSHLIVKCEKNLICIFMNFNKNIRNE